MNEDFSEVISKFKSILEDKNIEMPRMPNENYESSEKSVNFDLDIETILKIKNLIGNAKERSFAKIQLLKALKPFLNEKMQEKLEEYMKIVNIITILEILGENRR